MTQALKIVNQVLIDLNLPVLESLFDSHTPEIRKLSEFIRAHYYDVDHKIVSENKFQEILKELIYTYYNKE